MIVLSIMLAISPESAIRIRMWGEGIRVSVAWCRGVRGVGVVTRIVKSFKWLMVAVVLSYGESSW